MVQRHGKGQTSVGRVVGSAIVKERKMADDESKEVQSAMSDTDLEPSQQQIMVALKREIKKRGGHRASFTVMIQRATTTMSSGCDEAELSALLKQIKEKALELKRIDAVIMDLLLDHDVSDDDVAKEVLQCDEYQQRSIRL